MIQPIISSMRVPFLTFDSVTMSAYWLPMLDEHPFLTGLLSMALLAILFVSARLIVLKLFLPIVVRIAEKSVFTWDDVLVKHRVFHRFGDMFPFVVAYLAVPWFPGLEGEPGRLAQVVCTVSITVTLALSLSALLSSVDTIYIRRTEGKGRPIKGYVQILQVLVGLVTVILVIAQLINKSPTLLLSGLGAMTAVLLLIFRDTLLSFVAGVQMTTHDLIRVGDWIEMPGFNADGDVEDIALNVVKVRNWDQTITVIPTHKFLENSFRNWRGMFDSGGRRIMRSIHIDMTSIRFLEVAEIEKFRRMMALTDYIDTKVAEIEQYNREHVPSELLSEVTNRRELTNVGTFRAYISQYLRNHPEINQEMTFLIRQLQPTPQGLPIQIYVFTRDTRWVFHEGIQADIFDHLLAVLPEFDLRVYQQPTGADLQTLTALPRSVTNKRTLVTQ